MPLVEVTASGISSSSARKPIVMNGRLRDVRQDAGPVKILVQDQPRQEVQQHVEEGNRPSMRRSWISHGASNQSRSGVTRA